MIVAHFSWIQIFRYSNRGPRIEQITKHIISTVNLTRTALINAKPNKRFDFLTSIAQQEKDHKRWKNILLHFLIGFFWSTRRIICFFWSIRMTHVYFQWKWIKYIPLKDESSTTMRADFSWFYLDNFSKAILKTMWDNYIEKIFVAWSKAQHHFRVQRCNFSWLLTSKNFKVFFQCESRKNLRFFFLLPKCSPVMPTCTFFFWKRETFFSFEKTHQGRNWLNIYTFRAYFKTALQILCQLSRHAWYVSLLWLNCSINMQQTKKIQSSRLPQFKLKVQFWNDIH